MNNSPPDGGSLGTDITLIGIIPPTDDSAEVPTASYVLDGKRDPGRTLSVVHTCTRNQVFFEAHGLSPNTSHTLTINVSRTSPKVPYIIDYAFVCNNKKGSSDRSADGVSSKSKTLSKDGVIVGAVLGSIIFLLIATFLAWFLVRRRRRRQRQLRQLQIDASPVSSWLYSHSSESVIVCVPILAIGK